MHSKTPDSRNCQYLLLARKFCHLTRMEAVHGLQKYEEAGLIEVAPCIRTPNRAISSQGLSQLALLTRNMCPAGFVIYLESGFLLHATYAQPLHFISAQRACHVLTRGACLLAHNAHPTCFGRALICTQACRYDHWLGSAQPTAGACVQKEIFVQEEVPESRDLQRQLLADFHGDIAGGSSYQGVGAKSLFYPCRPEMLAALQLQTTRPTDIVAPRWPYTCCASNIQRCSLLPQTASLFSQSSKQLRHTC